MTTKNTQTLISGFWRRIGALLIDLILLGIIGFILGLFFYDTFVEIGDWGRVIGFSIALLYFSILNSNIAEGQTIGKILLKIRVVDSNKKAISFGKSLIRYFVLATPFSLNGAPIPEQVSGSLLMYPLALVVFGGVLSTLYLYIFNKGTRQSLHDLATGTFVVNENSVGTNFQSTIRLHKAVAATILVLATSVPILTPNISKSSEYKNLLATSSVLSNFPEVRKADITVGTTTINSLNSDKKSISFAHSNVYLEIDDTKNQDLAKMLAKGIASNIPNVEKKDIIKITLIYGFDIGISSSWYSKNYEFLPSDLMPPEKQKSNKNMVYGSKLPGTPTAPHM